MDVAEMPTFRAFAPQLNEFMKNCDFAGYNSNHFDLPLLVEEFLRVDVDFDLEGRKFVDIQTIFHKNEPRDLKAAFRFYCGKDLTNAHSAEADTVATYQILLSQLDRYSELKTTLNFCIDIQQETTSRLTWLVVSFSTKKGEVFNFGKHKGRSSG